MSVLVIIHHLIALRAAKSFSIAGAKVTRKKTGNKKITVGKIILSGANWARSSARWRRWTADSAWMERPAQ
jgi:hypothetical protein